MKQFVFIIFILFCFVAKQQAQNLIANGSFESYTNPLNCYGGFDNYNATPTYHVLDNWYTLNSCDYFNGICNPSTYYSTPNNVFGNQLPRDGSAYVGFTSIQFQSEVKEYLYQHFGAPLQTGKIYCLSFWVSRADRKEFATKTIGAVFSNTVLSTGSIGYINAMPQVVSPNNFLTDTTNWTEIQGCFTANGGEQYITIGNFNSNINTDTLYTGTNNPIPFDPQYAYYYIDDITLIDQSTVGINELDKENSFEIYPNPSNSILNIKSNIQQLQNATLEIKNTLGQVVYFDVYAPQINISDLPSGIYFITLNNKETKRTIKFVKN